MQLEGRPPPTRFVDTSVRDFAHVVCSLRTLSIFEKLHPKAFPLIAFLVGFCFLGSGQSYDTKYRPSSQHTLWAYCVDQNNYIIPSCPVNLGVGVYLNTNGHFHDSPSRPISSIWPQSGTTSAIAPYALAVTLSTTLVGQAELAMVEPNLPLAVMGYMEYVVGYSDIYWNHHSDIWVQTGATANHGGVEFNHWMAWNAAQGIYHASRQFLLVEYPQFQRIAVNDMALPFGGIFDINGNWAGPHYQHSRGTAVDIRGNTLPNNVPVSLQSRFRQLCIDFGAADNLSFIEHTTPGDNDTFVANSQRHIHCQWPNP